MKILIFLSVIRSLYGLSCEDYPECNGPFLDQNPNLYCGIRVSNDTRTGPKCIYMLKARDKEPQSRTACAALTYKEVGFSGLPRTIPFLYCNQLFFTVSFTTNM